MPIIDGRDLLAVSHKIGLAGETDDDFVLPRVSHCLVGRCPNPCKRRKFGMIETDDRRPPANEFAGKHGARRRSIDKDRIEYPGKLVTSRGFHSDHSCLAPFGNECSQIDKSPCAPAMTWPISSCDKVIDGTHPAAKSTLAVKF